MIDVNLNQFQGPLSLLLAIIEKEELDITSINLAKIANEYLDYIEKSKDEIAPERMADFLLMASKLLYIKSKALLPYLINDEDEEEEDLEKQLKMYKEFVDLSRSLADLIAKKKISFSRVINKKGKKFFFLGDCFFPPKNISKKSLHSSFLLLLEKSQIKTEELERDTIVSEMSIDEKIHQIRDLLKKNINFNFTKILTKSSSKTELVVNFLAVLELCKQRELYFEQDSLFSDIHISSKPAQDLIT